MPCYRCGARQVDPERGPSPWQRGVRAAQQVLVCPACQAGHDWQADLDRCARCGSARLVRRLGEIECRDCGLVVPPDEPAQAGPGSAASAAPGLAEEVALALDRVLGRRAGLLPGARI
jgi:hypothetical protein